MHNLKLSASCCAAITLCSLPAQAVLHVGPGSSYSTIQSAINAASPGDSIVVLGAYSESILINKPLRIVHSAQPNSMFLISGDVTIDGIGAAGSVTISGLTIFGRGSGDRLLVRNCQGPVMLDKVIAAEWSASGGTLWCRTDIQQCGLVSFNECNVTDVTIHASTVSFAQCNVRATTKESTYNTCYPTAGPGQCSATDSIVTASSTNFAGAPILSVNLPALCVRQNPVVYCHGSRAFALTNSQLFLGKGSTASSPLPGVIACDSASTIEADASLAHITYGACQMSITEIPSLGVQGMVSGMSGFASVLSEANRFVIIMASFPAHPSHNPLFTLPIGLDLPSAWFAGSGITDSQGVYSASFASGLGLGPPGLTFSLQAVVLDNSSARITPAGIMVIR